MPLLALLLCLLLTAPAACATTHPASALRDDLTTAGLNPAIARSLTILARLPPERAFALCGASYRAADLAASLRALAATVAEATDPDHLAHLLQERFHFCPAGGEEGLFLTGYYEPEVRGSLAPDDRYRYPLYAPPPDLVSGNGQSGRLTEGRLRPYWSRGEIERDNLLAGLELVWLDDPLAAFVLHVQGSGRVRLPDGSRRAVRYAAKNGRPYRSIGRVLVEEGALSREEADLPAILAWLRANPDQKQRVLHHNESYIFFRWAEEADAPPLGSFGVELTAGRSLALDQKHYPPGIPAWLAGQKPVVDEAGKIVGWQTFGRLVFNQDSGSAIVGPGRADLFWGSDRYAEIAAGVTRHPAQFHLLLKKDLASAP